MGAFFNKPTCEICQEECDFPKFKIKDDGWLCQDCLKDAGINSVEASNMTAAEIKLRIAKKNSNTTEAKRMYRYAVDNGFGTGFNENWGIKHFLIIQNHLLPGEKVLMTFIGLHNYTSATKHDSHFAYAITNKRFIMAQKQMMSGETLQTVYLDNINDVTYSSSIMGGTVTIDTIKEVFNVHMDKDSAKRVNSEIINILHSLRNNSVVTTPQSSPETSISVADEIMKFKQLLDAQIITQEEFDKKKQQLLNS